MSRTYRNLILGLGTYEGSLMPTLSVAFLDGEFETPREILQAFRDCLMALVTETFKDAHADTCPHCEHKTRTLTANFCEFCGKPLKDGELDLNEQASLRFDRWFKQELNEFTDWDFFAMNGWNVTWTVSGGYVSLAGFDQLLEEWDPEDWEDNLGEGRSWWDNVLSNVETGELKVDVDEEDEE